MGKKKRLTKFSLVFFFDIKKNHAIFAWFSRGLPVSGKEPYPAGEGKSETLLTGSR